MGELGKLVLSVSAVAAAVIVADAVYRYGERKDLEWRMGRKLEYTCAIEQEIVTKIFFGKAFAYTTKEREHCEYTMPLSRRIYP